MNENEKNTRAIQSRLNRISSNNNKVKESMVAKKIMDIFEKKDYLTLQRIFAPTVGFDSPSTRRALDVYFCKIDKRRQAGALRAILIDCLNIFNFSRGEKKIFLDLITYGLNPENEYGNHVFLCLNRISENEKHDGYQYIEFKKLKKLFDISKHEGGDIFKRIEISSEISNDTKNYMKQMLIEMKVHMYGLTRLYQGHLEDSAFRNNSPIAYNGFLSGFRKRKDEEKITYDSIMAHVFVETAKVAEINLSLLLTSLLNEIRSQKETEEI